jgi:hypothetical protein
MTSTPSQRGNATWRLVVLWAVVSVACWAAARATERHTRLEVVSTGSRIEAVADDSSISAPLTVESLRRLEILATSSPFPPGGRILEVTQGSETVLVDRLPARFELPMGDAPPVGDWEIDDQAGTGTAYARELRLEGSFELEATFIGRAHQHVVVAMIGTPPFAASFRRGLINNDLFLWDADWRPMAVTSIDPSPVDDSLAALSLLLDSAAAAAGLIALFLLIARIGPGGEVAGSPRGAGRVAAAAAAITLAAAAGSSSLWLADRVLERLPHLPDSVVYLLQASWLADGKLYQVASAIQEYLDVPFTYAWAGRWVAHYPVGWPLLLAAGLWVGAPWAVTPILGAVYVLLVWRLGRDLFDSPTGLVAAALAALSPMSRLIFGSYLSHAASSVAFVLALLLTAAAIRRASPLAAGGAGLVVGLALGVRPLAAVAVAIPMAALMFDNLRRADRQRDAVNLILAATVGGLVGVVPVTAANLVITGNPLAFPYTLAKGSMYGLANIPFGIQNLDAILASTIPSLYGWGWGSSWVWLFQALPLAFAWVPFLLRRASRWDIALAGVVICLAAAHIGTKAHGLHGFGPRYYFDAFCALYLLTARGFRELARIAADAYPVTRGARPAAGIVTSAVAIALFAGLCLPAALSLPGRLELYRGYNGVDGSLEHAVTAAGLDRAAVVFTGSDWQDWAMASRYMTGQLDADLVFARGLDSLPTLRASYPDRPVYAWRDGTLEEVTGDR